MTYKESRFLGAVLLTDGADRSGADIAKFAMQIRERKLPVHTVGIGSAAGNPDLEIVKVDIPRTAEGRFSSRDVAHTQTQRLLRKES